MALSDEVAQQPRMIPVGYESQGCRYPMVHMTLSLESDAESDAMTLPSVASPLAQFHRSSLAIVPGILDQDEPIRVLQKVADRTRGSSCYEPVHKRWENLDLAALLIELR